MKASSRLRDQIMTGREGKPATSPYFQLVKRASIVMPGKRFCGPHRSCPTWRAALAAPRFCVGEPVLSSNAIASRRPAALRPCCALGRGQGSLSRQHLGDAQSTQLAARTLQDIHVGHSCHKVFRGLDGLGVTRWHLQCLACRSQLERLAAGCQHAVVANALRSGGQHMQHEAVHKLCSR